jgi:methyl-accepting chemotaxis protein
MELLLRFLVSISIWPQCQYETLAQMKLNKLRIGMRLAVGYSILLLIMLVCSIIGVVRLNDLHLQLLQITEINNVQASLSIAMRDTVADRMIALRNIVLFQGQNDAPEIARVEEQSRRYNDCEASLLKALSIDATPKEKDLMSQLSVISKRAAPVIEKVESLTTREAYAEATVTLIQELRPIQKDWMTILSELVSLQHEQNTSAAADGDESYKYGKTILISLTSAALLLGVMVAYFTTNSIVRPLGTSVTLAQAVAKGDLTRQIADEGRDETAQLLNALATMNGSLKKIVSEVRDSTGNVLRASQEIAVGNQDLSNRTEQQASALEQTAAAMTELTETVKQNAHGAHAAECLAHQCDQSVQNGTSVMTSAIDKMEAIASASRRVTEITGVIDSIAFQTNILALNAAVEAARAGEQGRGFAVVATEVRNLAQRAGAAAKEIKVLIDETANFVAEGTVLVKSAGSAMAKVSTDMVSLGETVRQIAAASHAQAGDIEQVNRAITDMDSSTQQNAALVEESAAAAESLQMQVKHLDGLVQHFQIGSAVAPATKYPVKQLALGSSNILSR